MVSRRRKRLWVRGKGRGLVGGSGTKTKREHGLISSRGKKEIKGGKLSYQKSGEGGGEKTLSSARSTLKQSSQR